MPAIEILVPHDLTPDEYRHRVCTAVIVAKYGTIQAFAKSLGVSRQAIYHTLAGRFGGGRVAGALSALTGIPREALFPSQEKAA